MTGEKATVNVVRVEHAELVVVDEHTAREARCNG
jgi:hypothetical protein